MAWVLAAWIPQLRAELAQVAPGRDRASDGTIGDAAHKLSPSGHNPDDTPGSLAEAQDADTIPEVRAVDVDVDLRVPGLTAAMLVAHLVGRARAGLERRLLYVIYDRTIWSASAGWQARRYTGSNPHTSHIHVSGHPDGDTDARPFGLADLLEDEMTQFVRELQDTLRAAKFDPGPTDGKLGPKTLAAWSAHIAHATNSFQWKQPDGRMGLALYSYARDATGAATQARDEVRQLRELVDAPDEPAPPPVTADELAAAMVRELIRLAAPPAPGSAS